jgi:hypothetical protein
MPLALNRVRANLDGLHETCDIPTACDSSVGGTPAPSPPLLSLSVLHLVLLLPVVITFILHVHCPTHPRRPIVAQFRVYMNRILAHCRPNNTTENNTQHSMLCGPCGAVLVHVSLPVPTGGSVVIHEQDNEQRNNGGRREGRSSTKRVVKLYK